MLDDSSLLLAWQARIADLSRRTAAAALVAVAAFFFTGSSISVRSAPQKAAAGTDPVIAAAGDIACDPTNSNFNGGNGANDACMEQATANLIGAANPSAVLLLGDNQYYCGGYPAFQQSYDLSWGKYKSITYPSVGNHEYLTSGGTGCDSTNAHAAGYFNYFGAAAGQVGHGFYSFNVGSWHLIAINSNCGDAGGCGSGSPQYTWLQSDLAAHKGVCTLAFWHIPLFSSGGRAASNTKPEWDLLYAAHADVVLNGHDHIYERFAPQNPSGALDTTNGIREFIAGTGGANHTSIATVAANSEVRNTATFGLLELTLHQASYGWNFVPIAGKTFTDSGTQACHDASSGGNGAPAPPQLSISGSGTGEFIPSGAKSVFYNPNAAASGSFTVSASVDSTTTQVQFPTIFGSDGGNTTGPFSQTYQWNSSSTASNIFQATASNGSVSSAPASFTVTRDVTAPATTASCNNGADCSGTYSGSVNVALQASDAGAGVQTIYYSTNGSPPTTPYLSQFSVTAGTTISYYAVDNVGNQETTHTVTITAGTGGGGGGGGGGSITLIRQASSSVSSGTSLNVSLASGNGDALVATIALSAGSSASVSSVRDSSSATWTKGPIGYLSGANSRVEIWYRLNAGPITSVTITTSASKAIAATVSEWSGVGTTVDGQASGSNASSTTATTPSITNGNSTDLVVGAINYPTNTTATLAGSGFAGLNDFTSGSLVHGHDAYKVTAVTGSQQASWTLASSSGGTGTAILALKAGATGPPTPAAPVLSVVGSDPGEYIPSGSTTVFYNPNASSGGGSFTVSASVDANTTQVTFPSVFASETNSQSGPTFSQTYTWDSSSSASGPAQVTASNGSVSSQPATFTVTPDIAAPTTSASCNGGADCAGTYNGTVTVRLNATDNGGSGVNGIYYSTDGSAPTTPYSDANPLQVPAGTTITFDAADHVGNQETPQSIILTQAPAPPLLSVTGTDPGEFVPSGSTTVFYNPNAPSGSGSFTVSASVDANTTQVTFPSVFASEMNSQSGPTFSQIYTWNSGSNASGQRQVTASNGSVNSQPATFTVTPDTTAPTTSASCNGGANCAGTYTGTVTVRLSAADGSGSGVNGIYYSTDGSPPTTAYSNANPPQIPAGSTITFYSVDNVGNQEGTHSVTPALGSAGIKFVRQATGSVASASSLTVPIGVSSGDALVATIALNTGSSASVSSVTDSTGATWTKGPIGYLSGANTRIEIWYRLGAPALTSVTIKTSTSKAIGVTVSEWSGVASTTDGQAGGSSASSTTATTSAVTTKNASDLVIGAINYPANATASVKTAGFTSLNDFPASGVHGKAAYKLTTAVGSQQVSWALTASSGGAGTAILIFKAA